MATSSTADQGSLRRVLGFWGTAAVSIGVMAPTLAMSVVGPEPARLVGRAAPLAFVAAAALVLAVSAGFISLSGEFAHAGSVYAFVGHSVGPRSGAFTGWVLLGTYLVFPWVSVAGITTFAQGLLRTLGVDPPDWYLLALAGWLVVGLLAAGGIRPTSRALLAFEAAAVLLILALMAVIVHAITTGSAPAAQHIDVAVFTLPDGVPVSALVLAATAAFLAFAGFESAGSLGEEARAPRRVVPRAMLATITAGAIFYVACVAVQSWGFGTDPAGVARFAGSSAPLGELAATYAGPGLAAALYAVAVISAVGAGLGCVLVAVRTLFAFGRDGLLPHVLARVSPRSGAPSAALGLEMGLGLILISGFRLAGTTPIGMFFALATIGVLNLLVMYTITNLAAARHHWRSHGPVRRLLLPLVGAVVALAVLVQTIWPPVTVLPVVVVGWLVLGGLFVFIDRVRLQGALPEPEG